MAYPPVTPPSTIDVTDVTAQTSRHSGDHNALADWLAVLIPGPWVYVNPAGAGAPAFSSPWANFGQGWQTVRFRREGGDICRIEGAVAGGTAGTALFYLPIGYRPAQNLRFIHAVDATALGIDRFDVQSSGLVYVQGLGAGASGTVAFASVNCTFVIDPNQL